MLTVNVCNIPEDINYDFIVARIDKNQLWGKNQLWYWDSYETEEETNAVAVELGEAIVVKRE